MHCTLRSVHTYIHRYIYVCLYVELCNVRERVNSMCIHTWRSACIDCLFSASVCVCMPRQKRGRHTGALQGCLCTIHKQLEVFNGEEKGARGSFRFVFSFCQDANHETLRDASLAVRSLLSRVQGDDEGVLPCFPRGRHLFRACSPSVSFFLCFIVIAVLYRYSSLS